MFEKTLSDLFATIFDFKNVKYDQPGESREQETLFVEIENARPNITDGQFNARVEGKATIFAQNDKLPFGYFGKAIEAHPEECKSLFFFNIEENQRTYGNIVQRGFSFVFFFNSQYDPALGIINEVTTTVEVNT